MISRSFLWLAVAVALAAHPAPASARTLDLVTYSPPNGWSVEEKTGSDGAHAVLTKAGATSYCMVVIYPSTPAGRDLGASFSAEWQAVALKTIADVEAPDFTTRRVGNTTAAVGSAASTAGGQPAIAKLLVLDAGARVVSVLVLSPSAATLKTYESEVEAMLSGLVVKRSGTPSETSSRDAAPASGKPAAARPTRIAELAGDWALTDGINVTYVDRYTGSYAGTDSLHFSEKWVITSQGGISLDFFGIQNGKKLSENSSGTVTLSNGILVVKMSNTQKYVLRGWYDGAAATVMVLNGPWYEEIPADILSNPEQGSNLDKKWLRKK